MLDAIALKKGTYAILLAFPRQFVDLTKCNGAIFIVKAYKCIV